MTPALMSPSMKDDESEFAARAVGPSGVAQSFRDRERFAPGLLGENRVKIFVCFALDDEATESNAIVGLEDRIVEVVGEALRHFRDGQARELAAESIDLGVQGIAAIAARGEQALRFGVDRLGAGPGLQPGESVSLLKELVGIARILGKRGLPENRGQADGAQAQSQLDGTRPPGPLRVASRVAGEPPGCRCSTHLNLLNACFRKNLTNASTAPDRSLIRPTPRNQPTSRDNTRASQRLALAIGDRARSETSDLAPRTRG